MHDWRVLTLLRAGYGAESAELLATTDADLHDMVDIKARGVSDEQAMRIYS